ncbi:uncharacterized protein LOC143363956 [Halictus rubicundus]|uniref:uncharacterized protein LOC143363956 n=1 Tax=Halictus rubicundus TaxID=77578 RepID=UPI0040357277
MSAHFHGQNPLDRTALDAWCIDIALIGKELPWKRSCFNLYTTGEEGIEETQLPNNNWQIGKVLLIGNQPTTQSTPRHSLKQRTLLWKKVQLLFNTISSDILYEAAIAFSTTCEGFLDSISIFFNIAEIMSEQMKTLKRQCASIKAQLTRIKNSLTSSLEISALNVRKSKITELYDNFHSIIIELEALDESGDYQSHIIEFEDSYYACAESLDKLQNSKNAAPSEKSDTRRNNANDNVKGNGILPKIKLPTFDGNLLEWQSFHDSFLSMVHENEDLLYVQKFHYLKHSLHGEIASVIDTLSASKENYLVAWSILVKRCTQPRRIIQAHLKSLFELPSLTHDDPVALRSLITATEKHVNALKAISVPVHSWNEILTYIITSKLDKTTRREWDRSLNDQDLPKLDDLLNFLLKFSRDDAVVHLENPHETGRAQLPARASNKVLNQERSSRSGHQSYVSTQEKIVKCQLCSKSHNIQNCERFLSLSINDRFNVAKNAKLCINCLKAGHSCSKCYCGTCKKCQRKHHTLLHRTEDVNNSLASNSCAAPAEQSHTSLTASIPSEVLLSTTRAFILDNQNVQHDCRILLDSGSQVNFITEELANKLKLPKTSIDVPVFGINQVESRIKHTVRTTIASKTSNYKAQIRFYTIPQIACYLPTQQINRSIVNIPKNIQLADPEYHKPSKIDALLGAELFYQLLSVGQIYLFKKSLVLQKTVMGWILSGTIPSNKPALNSIKCHLSTSSIDDQIAKFWELEEYPTEKIASKEEELCESHFREHTSRNSSGRYIVRLPFAPNKSNLGTSYEIALKRFYNLEKRLIQNTALKQEYSRFIQEYRVLGHMTDISKNDCRKDGYYLPHHPVFKQSSLTTKLRVVFDASAITSNELSLNDVLLVGPTIQDDLFSLLVRFRLHNYVLTADIEKMYRQVLVHQDDAAYQKILWRENINEQIKTFRLDTVTYGTASASFLAIRALQQLVQDEGRPYPLASKSIVNDFYVDDLLTGASTYEEAVKLRDELIKLTSKAKFHLRQWASNETSLLKDLVDKSLKDTHEINSNSIVKTLGVLWNSSTDVITYSTNMNTSNSRITKRTILSSTAQLFDPLGLLGPVIVKAKMIMQDLWKAKLDWDESVPQHIYSDWEDYKQQLSCLSQFKIPRKIIATAASEIQLHGFCDASEKAYGACIYIRSRQADGSTTVRLIASKSRVAPLNSTTIPRLELCAAVLLSKLYVNVKRALSIQFNCTRLWTDSTIVLCWINTSSNTLKTFVANRVSKIQAVTQSNDWRHVPSQQNPADAISRGQNPIEFLNNELWIQGPSWLHQSEDAWPLSPMPSAKVPELRTITALTINCNNELFLRFSSFVMLKRVIAYCYRFYNNASKKYIRHGKINVEELNHAHDQIIKTLQHEHFKREIDALNSGKTLDKRSKILNLNPFLDEQGILRVGGRLHHSLLDYNQKHPILLPRTHHVTKLIIREHHIKNYHSGVQSTLNVVRQRYWIIDGKNFTRHIIRKCIRCQRARPSDMNYIMENLPKNRVQQSRPFEISGVDYCGPLFVKEKKFRNRGKIKVYVCVFVCFATKAAHMELVSDLTTESFIACLKRFFSRRGKSRHIYSDNATNFVGANNELKNLLDFLKNETFVHRVTQYLTNEGVTWHFSPPRSPHFGGLWEALVKSFKHHLIRTVGDQLFTYEQLNTYIIEIEAILNSRPLTPMSSDPNDTSALTPAHFLIGDSLKSIPEHDLQHVSSNKLSTWQHIQRVKQHFWARWHKEYVNQLSIRSKWRTSSSQQPRIGDLVILKEDNVPPMQWHLGRIIELHPGDDNVIRVVTVKTVSGTYKRSVKRIYLDYFRYITFCVTYIINFKIPP